MSRKAKRKAKNRSQGNPVAPATRPQVDGSRSPKADVREPPRSGRGGSRWRILSAILGTALLIVLGVLVVLVARLFPARQSAREAARRTHCMNNLKQINLALFTYNSKHGGLPPASIIDENGRPLLSWRVAILPYLNLGDFENLYDRFHLDEPWDSPHNRALLDEMPNIYACPSHAGDESSETTYRVFEGPGTAFEEPGGHSPSRFPDGTYSTILVVEADEAVPWTRPDPLQFNPDPQSDLPAMGSAHPGGFNAAFGEGDLMFLRDSISKSNLRAMITRNGGEIISADEF